MLLYGASGHAKVIISSILSENKNILGVFDDDLSKKEIFGFPVIGAYKKDFYSENEIIIAIGHNGIRRKIAEKLTHPFGTTIHQSAIVDPSVKIEEGTVVLHGAIIQADSKIGKHVIINTGASVDHDAIISDFIHIAPNAVLCGNVTVGENSFIGANSTIIPGITIGKNCIVGAGTVVLKNIPDNCTVVGNPGKIVK